MAFDVRLLSFDEWSALRDEHIGALAPLTARFRDWRGKGKVHPVYDFLFTYYTFSSRKLEEWHPGFGVGLEYRAGSYADNLLQRPQYRATEQGVTVLVEALRPHDVRQLRWVQSLCGAIAGRESRFSCFGLHEWAMVYRDGDVRHDYPLRLSRGEIAAVVESNQYCCSHFDAYRFASPAAQKLNVLRPQADTRISDEQGGCIHANMDLYKWAFKLLPFSSSDLVRRCFQLAYSARETDMRASPYDLRRLGFAPIEIETPEGKLVFEREQRAIAAQAAEFRHELRTLCDNVLSLATSCAPSAELADAAWQETPI